MLNGGRVPIRRRQLSLTCFCLFIKPGASQFVSLRKQLFHPLECRFTWAEHTDKMLRRVVRMRHDAVKGGVIIAGVFGSFLVEQRLKSLLADTDVQPEYARTIKVGNAVILVVTGRHCGERQLAFRAVEKKDVPKICGGLDLRKGPGDVFRQGCIVHERIQASSSNERTSKQAQERLLRQDHDSIKAPCGKARG